MDRALTRVACLAVSVESEFGKNELWKHAHPASSRRPFRQTSTINPAIITRASKHWNLDLKNLSVGISND